MRLFFSLFYVFSPTRKDLGWTHYLKNCCIFGFLAAFQLTYQQSL